MLLAPYVPSIRPPAPPDSANGGVGSPEGVVTASPYRPYYRTDTNTYYVKETGEGTNTGWVALSGGSGGSGQVTQGSGAPSAEPVDPDSAAIYTDLDDGVIYTWNVDTQAWI